MNNERNETIRHNNRVFLLWRAFNGRWPEADKAVNFEAGYKAGYAAAVEAICKRKDVK